MWIVIAQIIVSGVALSATITDPTGDLENLTTSTPLLVAGLLSLWSVFLGYPWIASRLRGTGSLARDFGFVVPVGKALLAGVGLGLGLRALSIGATVAAERLGMTTGENSSWLTQERAVLATVFLLSATAVLGPVLEELFFRGLLMKSILGWTSSPLLRRLQGAPMGPTAMRRWSRAAPTVAVVVSSVVFGLMHLTGADAGGLFVVATTATVGAVFAVVSLRTGTLAVAIAGHVAFNSSGVALMLLGVAG